MQSRSLITGLLLKCKEIDRSPSVHCCLMSYRVQREERQGRTEGRGIVCLSHAFIRSTQRPGQHHALYISFRTQFTSAPEPLGSLWHQSNLERKTHPWSKWMQTNLMHAESTERFEASQNHVKMKKSRTYSTTLKNKETKGNNTRASRSWWSL